MPVVTSGTVIEAALVADGVPMDKLYPIDVNRAFKSLGRLGNNNIIWQTSNQEPVLTLTSGETQLAGIYTGRAIIANRGGAKIGLSLNQGFVGGDYLGVIENARHKKEAFELLNYIATKPARAAEFTAMTAYAVPIRNIEKYLPKDATDIRMTFPTSPELADKVHVMNSKWWSTHLEQVATRFKEWELS